MKVNKKQNIEQPPQDVIDRLASDYQKDLDALRSFDVVDITGLHDVKRLQIIASKYGYEKPEEITKQDFHIVVGKLSNIILNKFEELVVEHVLERVRDETENKFAKKPKIVREKVPEDVGDDD